MHCDQLVKLNMDILLAETILPEEAVEFFSLLKNIPFWFKYEKKRNENNLIKKQKIENKGMSS